MLFSQKKDGNPATMTTWMDPEGMMSTEISQTNERQVQNDLTLMWNIKETFLTHRNRECHGGCQWLRAEGNGKILVKVYKLPVIRAISIYSDKQLGDYS